MRDAQEDYLRFAAAARLEAASETLANVRQKHLLSAATWEGLAHSAQKVAEARARRVMGTVGSDTRYLSVGI
jgi:hypothetical protein